MFDSIFIAASEFNAAADMLPILLSFGVAMLTATILE